MYQMILWMSFLKNLTKTNKQGIILTMAQKELTRKQQKSKAARAKKYQKRFTKLALRYYGTSDLSSLSSFQLNKITNIVTNTNPDTMAHIKGNKHSGNTYKNYNKIFG